MSNKLTLRKDEGMGINLKITKYKVPWKNTFTNSLKTLRR
jgi:hypothetical protein